jgi:hypothetical protein
MATSKPGSPVSQTGPSSFCSPRPKATVKDYHAGDSSNTSLVSSRPHTKPEQEDLADEGTKDEEEVVEKKRDEYFNII